MKVSKTYNINVRIPQQQAEKLHAAADRLFEGNRSFLIRVAVARALRDIDAGVFDSDTAEHSEVKREG